MSVRSASGVDVDVRVLIEEGCEVTPVSRTQITLQLDLLFVVNFTFISLSLTLRAVYFLLIDKKPSILILTSANFSIGAGK